MSRMATKKKPTREPPQTWSSEDYRRVTGIAEALSDRTRLRLLVELEERREASVTELVAALEAPQSTVSRHLAILLRWGLVFAERRGKQVIYSEVPEATEAIEHLRVQFAPPDRRLVVD